MPRVPADAQRADGRGPERRHACADRAITPNHPSWQGRAGYWMRESCPYFVSESLGQMPHACTLMRTATGAGLGDGRRRPLRVVRPLGNLYGEQLAMMILREGGAFADDRNAARRASRYSSGNPPRPSSLWRLGPACAASAAAPFISARQASIFSCSSLAFSGTASPTRVLSTSPMSS